MAILDTFFVWVVDTLGHSWLITKPSNLKDFQTSSLKWGVKGWSKRAKFLKESFKQFLEEDFLKTAREIGFRVLESSDLPEMNWDYEGLMNFINFSLTKC